MPGDLSYVALLFVLFVVPRFLQRFRLPAAITSLALGILAGAFGFERGKYELSRSIAEHALWPAVRDADEDVLLIADGFSCREQIRHGTSRRAINIADVIAAGIDRGSAQRASA